MPETQSERAGTETAKRGQLNDGLVDDDRKGVIFMLIYTMLMSANLYCGKALFELNPTVGIMQITFVRGVLATIFMLLWLNKNLKHILIDSVEKSSLPSLIFRCL